MESNANDNNDRTRLILFAGLIPAVLAGIWYVGFTAEIGWVASIGAAILLAAVASFGNKFTAN